MKPYETPEIQVKLEKIKEAVLAVVPDTELIYLFGSYVNGTPHEHSDLDLFIVVPDSDKSQIDLLLDLQNEIYTKLGQFEPFDLIVNSSKSFYKNIKYPSFANIASTTGVKIYG